MALPFAVATALAQRGSAGPALARPTTLARWALAGGVCTSSFLLFLVGLRGSGPATAMTLRNTPIVFAQILALAMGEKVPRRQVLGRLLVAAGATLVVWR